MNAKIITWTLVGLLAVAGCIPSMNPVYQSQDLVFDTSVIGMWRQPSSRETWEFAKRDNKSYSLVYTSEEGQQGKFIAHLARIDGNLILDLFPDEAQSNAVGFYKFHLVPIHTIYLVRRTDPGLELAAVNYPWLDDYLADHPSAIQHATFGGRKLITAPTEQVQALVLSHLDAFTAQFELERVLQAEE